MRPKASSFQSANSRALSSTLHETDLTKAQIATRRVSEGNDSSAITKNKGEFKLPRNLMMRRNSLLILHFHQPAHKALAPTWKTEVKSMNSFQRFMEEVCLELGFAQLLHDGTDRQLDIPARDTTACILFWWALFVNRTEIYRRAIKRTFADLYGGSPDTVDVSWTTGCRRHALSQEARALQKRDKKAVSAWVW
jgi:hypothetical protein